jgi:hypothetical protein
MTWAQRTSRKVLWLVVAIVSGCGRQDIKVYSVPKEQPPLTSQPQLPADHPDISMADATPQLKWRRPEGWEEVPAGNMRVASFKVAGQNGQQADVSVIPLPGVAGDDPSNVNRWRGQVGLEPVSEEEIAKQAETVEVDGQPAALYDQAGESTRILAAIQRRAGTAWFFKMTGERNLVAQQKTVFVAFLESIQFATGGGLPPGHPEISAMPVAAATGPASGEGKPQWTAPAGWKEVPGGQFLVAKFIIAGDGGAQAAVNVSSSAGDGGGLAANVNRWRKQLGLDELSSDELSKTVKAIDDQTALVELRGADARSGQPAALVGVIVLQPGHAWFYKLMGDAKIVAAQKDAFVTFVQEVKY